MTEKSKEPTSEYLTPQELAIMLNMSLKWVVKHTQFHRIPGQIKMGRLWRYRRSEVEMRLLSGKFLLGLGEGK
jgi:excisionase family DNA binding protein